MRLNGSSLLEDTVTDITIRKKNEVYVTVKTEPHISQELSDLFTFDVPGAKFMPQYRSKYWDCLLYTSPSPRDLSTSRMPSSA